MSKRTPVEVGSPRPSLMWFRQDLRLADNPALADAAARGPVLLLYVLDTTDPWAPGGAGRWWLERSLVKLKGRIEALGGHLVLLRGDPMLILPALCQEHGIASVHWNRCYEPHAVARDTELKAVLAVGGVEVHSHPGNVIREPWTLKTGSGGPYKVFSPFWRALGPLGPKGAIEPAPDVLVSPEHPRGEALADWSLYRGRPDWAAGFGADWTPGEDGARAQLDRYVLGAHGGYGDQRNLPAVEGTSRLSPHLHWGEISVRTVWEAVTRAGGAHGEAYLRELGWRDFSTHLLFHWPNLPQANWRDTFDRVAWRQDQDALAAWQGGRTGYPIVDAGMRQLWQTGWMHNRVRMICASFLIKHLLQDWRAGQAWFWDTLVDADLANNSASWQWVAGSGADAAPYFRIFNPVTQGEKFDPEGAYVRRWVPELSRLEANVIHQPWTALPSALARAGVRLGTDYPLPIVDHKAARARALDAFAVLKGSSGEGVEG